MNNDPVFIATSVLSVICSLVYLVAYWTIRRKKNTLRNEWPGVSLIVPMWNEAKTIAATLDSIAVMKDHYPGPVEIIVIDDRSTDDSCARVEEYCRRYDYISLYRKKGVQGKSESLNQGIALARYELVGCVDADSYPMPDALTRIVEEFDTPKVGAATSMLVVNRPRHVVEWFQHVEYVFSNFVLMAFDAVDSVIVTRGPLSLFRKEVMEKINGFLPSGKTPTEDMEITLRIRKAGYDIRCSRNSKVLTTVMPTWRNLFWQRMRWNRGTLINLWLHRDMFFRRRFGFFGMFMLPTSILLISLTAGVFVYTIGRLVISLADNLPSIYNEAMASPLGDVIAVTTERIGAAPAVTTALLLAMWVIFLLGNGFGLVESRERLNGKYLLAMMATPFTYGPVLVFFWACAIAMQTVRSGVRWR